jgi:hypothetical protein
MILLGGGPYALPCACFVDGGYVRAHLQRAGLPVEFDPRALAKFVGPSQQVAVGGREFVVDRVFYYDAIDEAADEGEALRMNTYLQRVENLPEVKVGTLGFLRQSGRRDRPREQKGVDVQLAVDALEMAFAHRTAAVALVAGDADFAPLMEAVRRTGTYAFVLAWRTSLSNALRAAVGIMRLLGLVREGEGIAAGVLESLGVSLDTVMEVTDAARDVLLEKGFDPVFGARPMRRAIQNLIEDPLAEGLLHGRFQPGDTVLVDRAGEDLTLETKPATPEAEEAKVPVEASA